MCKFIFFKSVLFFALLLVTVSEVYSTIGGAGKEPVPISTPAPHYPLDERGIFVPGIVIATFYVTKKGDVDSVKILRATPPDLGFEEETIKAVKKWKFIPAIDLNKDTIACWFTLPIKFKPDSVKHFQVIQTPDSTKSKSDYLDKDVTQPVSSDSLPGPDDKVYADILPEVISASLPFYPEDARKTGERGIVILSILVDKNGDVVKAKVLKETPPGLGFKEKAVEAVQTWKFKPAMSKGQPVTIWVTQPIRFRLQ